MPRDDGIIMSWFVKVEGRVYGPYTGAQMRAFIGEGRVAAHSSVSDKREDGFKSAQDIAQLKTWLEEARRSPGERRPAPRRCAHRQFHHCRRTGRGQRRWL